jgi:hypothetical protein
MVATAMILAMTNCREHPQCRRLSRRRSISGASADAEVHTPVLQTEAFNV